jgi:predicted nucleic acid-binding protein
MHGIVLLELYAGASSLQDRRDIDALRGAARRLGRIYDPSGEDLCLAGMLLSDYARRAGSLRPRDHSHDCLIAIGAARACGSVLTLNAADMRRWARSLGRRGLQLRVAVP